MFSPASRFDWVVLTATDTPLAASGKLVPDGACQIPVAASAFPQMAAIAPHGVAVSGTPSIWTSSDGK